MRGSPPEGGAEVSDWEAEVAAAGMDSPSPPRTAVIEVEWFGPDDDSKVATAAEAACDSLMERLVDEGVIDPAVGLTLPDRVRLP